VHIVIDAQPDPALWRRAFRELLRRPIRRVRVVGAVFVLLGVLFAVVDDGSGGLLLIGIVLIVLGLVYAVLTPIRAVRASLRRMPPALQQPRHIELTDRSVRIALPLMSSEYAWAAFVELKEIPGMLMLMPARHQVVPVPLGGLTPYELAQLREFVANRQFVQR
jgi:uncharacterized protein YjeT (DUF2065 family)